MQIFKNKYEKDECDTLYGVYDIEGYEGELVQPYHKCIYNLNRNRIYRFDFKRDSKFWMDGKLYSAEEIINFL